MYLKFTSFPMEFPHSAQRDESFLVVNFHHTHRFVCRTPSNCWDASSLCVMDLWITTSCTEVNGKSHNHMYTCTPIRSNSNRYSDRTPWWGLDEGEITNHHFCHIFSTILCIYEQSTDLWNLKFTTPSVSNSLLHGQVHDNRHLSENNFRKLLHWTSWKI